MFETLGNAVLIVMTICGAFLVVAGAFLTFVQTPVSVNLAERSGAVFAVRKNEAVQASLFTLWMFLFVAEIIAAQSGFRSLFIRSLDVLLLSWTTLRNRRQIDFYYHGVAFETFFGRSRIVPWGEIRAERNGAGLVLSSKDGLRAKASPADENFRDAEEALKLTGKLASPAERS